VNGIFFSSSLALLLVKNPNRAHKTASESEWSNVTAGISSSSYASREMYRDLRNTRLQILDCFSVEPVPFIGLQAFVHRSERRALGNNRKFSNSDSHRFTFA
jgi:hypothetical protein